MAKVLLIEDDSETAREIMAELVSRGYDVDWAATGIDYRGLISTLLEAALTRPTGLR